jgi:hypothetical protein
MATALSIALRTDPGTTETFFTALAIASRRLIATEALLGFLEVVDEVAALARAGSARCWSALLHCSISSRSMACGAGRCWACSLTPPIWALRTDGSSWRVTTRARCCAPPAKVCSTPTSNAG